MNRLSLAAATIAMAIVLGVMGYTGYWILIHPDNVITKLFSAKITATDARIIIGPYPLTADLETLKNQKVILIVSLLDPAIPYEKKLLTQESQETQRLGMRFQNFPMGSILGRRIGTGYDENAVLAARAVETEAGKVYLHCYLGLHRVKVVSRLISKKGVETAEYLLRRGQRSSEDLAMDRAQAHYDAGRYAQTLKTLSGVKTLNSAGRLLQAWAQFHAGKMDSACRTFEDLMRRDPAFNAAAIGLGYCRLRGGDLPSAQKYFARALEATPNDVSARIGRGLARERMADAVGAKKDFEAALVLEPGNPEAASALARLGTRARGD
jgi:Flp pilus assembly protein TadD